MEDLDIPNLVNEFEEENRKGDELCLKRNENTLEESVFWINDLVQTIRVDFTSIR